MLTLLNIANFALIDELRVEFDEGLNLLTGETGSGKSIIVDALGVLMGSRFSSDLIKSGEERAAVEGLFHFQRHPVIENLLSAGGVEIEAGESREVVVRRELSAGGRSKIFINNRLATQSLLRDLRPFLVDIHGQGDQQTLFDPARHLAILDDYAAVNPVRDRVSGAFDEWSAINSDLERLRRDQAEKLQLIDTLKYQVEELRRAGLKPDEDEQLEEERRRLTNVEKLTSLTTEAFSLIYDDADSAVARLGQTTRRIEELAAYDEGMGQYVEGLKSARAVLEDLAFSLRGFLTRLEFSPERLDQIEARLTEVSRLKRKYGGSLAAALSHLSSAQERLQQIEGSEELEKTLEAGAREAATAYEKIARELHDQRAKAARRLERAITKELGEVALDHARFEARVETIKRDGDGRGPVFSRNGIDDVEFYFSANPGEDLRPLAKVASGGEASRLMLVLKTIAEAPEFPRTIVFDEIDSGIGGRVSDAVGGKLKKLSATNQVLCVTHQPQIARFADCHLLVEKSVAAGRTSVAVERLDRRGRVEELARMLTGAEITDTARKHAREMLKS
jgi:DNA repair protein RecN (Recombination protein N)